MKVYYSIDNIPPIKNPVVTLGTFDGVHLGHQKVIQFLKNSAKNVDGETVLFTFHPHPRMVLHPDDHGMLLIQSISERIKKLESCGVDHLILFPFDAEFSRLSATAFIRDIMVNKLKVKMMTIGYNHHFGRNREGDLELLKELGEVYDFEVEETPAFEDATVKISSTKIRKAISNGEIEKANRYLGAPFCFKGTVLEGDRIGTKLGFPTANILPEEPFQILPKNGVYAVKVSFDGTTYKGMLNIGQRPTITNEGELRIEVHIFGFDQRIYGAELSIEFYCRVRDEQHFVDLDSLKNQLKDDKVTCLNFLDKLSMES